MHLCVICMHFACALETSEEVSVSRHRRVYLAHTKAGLTDGKGLAQWIVKCLLHTPTCSFLLSFLGPGTGQQREAGRKGGRLAFWGALSSCGPSTPSRSSPRLKMRCASPYLFPPLPTTANARGGRQRADPRVPGLLETLGPGWSSPTPLQHHRAKLHLPLAFGSPGGGACGLQHRRDLPPHPSGLLGEHR